MTDATHIFTLSGLGKAPFSFEAVRENAFVIQGAVNKAGGTCDHCGTSIRWEHVIRSADGRVSTVGSECIRKAGDRGLIDAVKAEKRRVSQEKRRAKQAQAFEAAMAEQRERNGGLTDAEVWEQDREAEIQAEDKRRDIVREMLAPIATVLEHQDGRFCAQIAHDIRCGDVPRGRAQEIVAEICGKQIGRKGTDAFVAERDRVLDLIKSAPAL